MQLMQKMQMSLIKGAGTLATLMPMLSPKQIS